MSSHSTQQTAYPYNATVAGTPRHTHDHGWARAINRMIDQRYAFLNLQYDGTGYLFRGMRQGLAKALLNNHFWHYQAEHGTARLEQELNVLFCSQDLSDALALSRLWDNRSDAGILIFNSALFNNALRKRQAAMMATAEPGVVFKYPLLTSSFSLDDIAFLVVTPHFVENYVASGGRERNRLAHKTSTLETAGRLIMPESRTGSQNQRQFVAQSIENELSKRNISAAQIVTSPYKPSRKA